MLFSVISLGPKFKRRQISRPESAASSNAFRADGVYTGDTNAVATAVSRAYAQRRNTIKTTRRAGRNRGRIGTTVPNNVLTTPAEAAIVVAVVVL
jgi:hypothetical protein